MLCFYAICMVYKQGSGLKMRLEVKSGIALRETVRTMDVFVSAPNVRVFCQIPLEKKRNPSVHS